MDLGRCSLTAVGLIILWMGKCPTDLGASFFDSTHKGKSCEESQIFWLTWYVGAGVRCWLAWVVYCPTNHSRVTQA